MIEGFHHHIFQFVAEKLLHRGFVLRFYFGIVGEQTDGSKITSGFVAIGSEQLLHGFGAVRTIAQDLSKRVAASANRSQRFAKGVATRGHLGLIAAIIYEPLLCVSHRALEEARPFGDGLPSEVRRLRTFAVS